MRLEGFLVGNGMIWGVRRSIQAAKYNDPFSLVT